MKEKLKNNTNDQTVKDFKNFISKERKGEICEYTVNKNMPQKLHRMNYNTFKEMAKLTLQTTAEIPEGPNNTETYICPTCGTEKASKSRLTLHRKSNSTCNKVYIREMNAYHICPNDNCDSILQTKNDLAKHLLYHCGNNEAPFTDLQEAGKMDRRTYHGFGIPKKDLVTFKEKALYGERNEKWKC